MNDFTNNKKYGNFDVAINGASCTIHPPLPSCIRNNGQPREIVVTLTITDEYLVDVIFGANVNPAVGKVRIAPLVSALENFVNKNKAKITDPAKLMAAYWEGRAEDRLRQRERQEKKGNKRKNW